ncbi:hypothetical protein CL629_00035 [bacterium]|nr:hypothetical protein [bacterium]|tara:strand:- start:3854 stop:4867 length:1014 start_codon:yes stop_codon:yes gene_type:complete
MPKNIDNFIENLLSVLNPKQKKVISRRYGLQGKRETLQEIGNLLGITRERVRQIENQSITKIRKEAREHLVDLIQKATKHLESAGGVREDTLFVKEVQRIMSAGNVENLENKIRFFFFAAGEPLYARETPSTRSYWYLGGKAKAKLADFTNQILNTCKNTDRQKIIENTEFTEKIGSLAEAHFLTISKKFAWNAFGDFGLTSWPEINPKNVRDKAYLAVKKCGKPLHFEEIASLIHEQKISARPVNIQTVHNELIKDSRFVLVGRGMYALKEQGYEAGTVKEVISTLIKQKGPLHSKQVVELVNQKRFLKENTILLNLQNRKSFKRLGDGKYDIHQA